MPLRLGNPSPQRGRAAKNQTSTVIDNRLWGIGGAGSVAQATEKTLTVLEPAHRRKPSRELPFFQHLFSRLFRQVSFSLRL
ncbi:MAG: hypothetical protein A3G73_11040 [Rhodospirillales bacterium RIFCSPLOWO2_12_FULL_67_15]|nr:MAG: hypothetical protein A3G73_11040 [Rhodospirillales bacterium RIFCSPLOWO2_12_FULL_67_15]